MPLMFETGHPVCGDREAITTNTVRIVNADGRCLFEVRLVGEKTIEVAGVEMVKVNDRIFGQQLCVRPRATNVVEVTVAEYEEAK